MRLSKMRYSHKLKEENERLTYELEIALQDMNIYKEKVFEYKQTYVNHQSLADDAKYWKTKFDLSQNEIIDKEQRIQQQLQYMEDLKDEIYKAREEVRAKNLLYDAEQRNLEVFELKQEVDRLKHELLLQQNDNMTLRNDAETYKLQATQNKLMADTKERAYNDLRLQYKDLQLQNERIKRISLASNSSIDSLIYKNFIPFSPLYDLDTDLSEVYKTHSEVDSKLGSKEDLPISPVAVPVVSSPSVSKSVPKESIGNLS